MARPINETQRRFSVLCAHGGGTNGGPAKHKVLELLRATGQEVNRFAYTQTRQHFAAYPTANPWHVCFAVGLAWGHLARLDVAFTGHVVDTLTELNDHDLQAACQFHLERGPEPIRKSLLGAYSLFEKVTLPAALPDSLERLWTAEQRWLSPVLSPARPSYIGSWNATAMFMAALFAQPALAQTQRTRGPILPPGGPIHAGLKMLHAAGVVSTAPAGSDLDDQAFEPGALYENNALLEELVTGLPDWCLIDAHSGIYMLCTRDPHTDAWFSLPAL